jgi:hypothetical protein
MPVTTFALDDYTLNTLRELQAVFGVKTNAAVLRRAIALAKIAATQASEDRTVTISGAEDKKPLTISLAA